MYKSGDLDRSQLVPLSPKGVRPEDLTWVQGFLDNFYDKNNGSSPNTYHQNELPLDKGNRFPATETFILNETDVLEEESYTYLKSHFYKEVSQRQIVRDGLAHVNKQKKLKTSSTSLIDLHTLLKEANEPWYEGPLEEALEQQFEDLVLFTRLKDVLHLQPGRKEPGNLDDYCLVPLTAIKHLTGGKSASQAGSAINVPEGVKCNYGSKGGRPFLDSSYAIGLVYRGNLAAVAAAHITHEGNLRVVQLQAVNADASDPKKKYKTGLHGGFYWRDTLVEAWASVAQELGIEHIEIQGAGKNKWGRIQWLPHLAAGYDKVANRMGFKSHPGLGIWRKPIRSEQTESLSAAG